MPTTAISTVPASAKTIAIQTREWLTGPSQGNSVILGSPDDLFKTAR
jgi:hypothetical protein